MKIIGILALLIANVSSAADREWVKLTAINVLKDIKVDDRAEGDDYYQVVQTDKKSGSICRVHVDHNVGAGTVYQIAADGSNTTFISQPGYFYLRSNKSGPGLSIDCLGPRYIDNVNDALADVVRVDFAEVEQPNP